MNYWFKGGIIGLIVGIILILFNIFIRQDVQSIIKGLLVTVGLGILVGILIGKWHKNEKIISDESLGKWGFYLSILTFFVVPYFSYLVESSKFGYSVFISFFFAIISLILCFVQNKNKKTKIAKAGLILSIILLIIFGIWILLFLPWMIGFSGRNGQ